MVQSRRIYTSVLPRVEYSLMDPGRRLIQLVEHIRDLTGSKTLLR